MNSFIRVVSAFLAFNLIVLSLPAGAATVNDLSMNIPNIQSVNASERSGPTTSSDTALESAIDPGSYMLGPGDNLGVHIIVGQGDLTLDQNLFVGADGKVFFPNIGEIYLSGYSLKDAKAVIDRSIKRTYKEKYELSVLLIQPKKVKIYLTGMAKNPGPLAVYDNLRVSEVIAQAGGVASGASNRYVYIKRKDNNGGEKVLIADLFASYRSKDLSKDVRVWAGDVIEIPDANNELISKSPDGKQNDKLLFEGHETYVYVYGEVARSGRFEFIPGKRLSDYISYAGGPTPKALLGSATLTRQKDGKTDKFGVNASDAIYNSSRENDIEIMGGDVISIPGNFFYVSDFTGFANTILLALTLYNSVARR